MPWLFAAILAYFLLAIVTLVDKYLLGGLMPSPKVYAFYVGIFGILALVLVPFGFLIPSPFQILLALLAGIFHILAILVYYNGLKSFEASRIVPAIGGLLPIFTFGLIYFFSGGKETLSFIKIIAFFMLILGSISIAWERKKRVSLKSLQISALAAFLFALYFILVKFVYLEQPFISGFIWTRIGAFLLAITLFFSKEVRTELFIKKKTFNLKTWGIFIPNGAAAAGASILQNWAIALAGIAYVAVISALVGIQYVFVLIFAILLSLKSPKILKEEVSTAIVLHKALALFLIAGGLVLLAF